jgi:hypothetical protein
LKLLDKALGDMAAQPQRPLVDQIADRHSEIESLVRVVAKEWKTATQQDRRHEWYLSVLLVGAVLFIIGTSATLSISGRFSSEIAFVMGTALGAFAAILKDFLLPVAD